MPNAYEQCPLCEHHGLKDKYKNVNGFTITRCDVCGLVFVREQLSTTELLEYYKSDTDDYIYSDADNVENLNYYFRRLRAQIERRVPFGRVLDVGCSGGYFLDAMEGWDRYGIEIPSVWAEMARQRYGDRIHVGTLEDVTYGDGYFELGRPIQCPTPLQPAAEARRNSGHQGPQHRLSLCPLGWQPLLRNHPAVSHYLLQ